MNFKFIDQKEISNPYSLALKRELFYTMLLVNLYFKSLNIKSLNKMNY